MLLHVLQFLQTKPVSVHRHPEVAEVQGVVRRSRGRRGPVRSRHLEVRSGAVLRQSTSYPLPKKTSKVGKQGQRRKLAAGDGGRRGPFLLLSAFPPHFRVAVREEGDLSQFLSPGAAASSSSTFPSTPLVYVQSIDWPALRESHLPPLALPIRTESGPVPALFQLPSGSKRAELPKHDAFFILTWTSQLILFYLVCSISTVYSH